MRISELEQGTSLSFVTNIEGTAENGDGGQITLSSVVVGTPPKKNGILAAGIYQKNKIISFKGDHIKVNMIATFKDNKPLLFSNVDIMLVKQGANVCYLITCTEQGKPINRRESYRCFVGLPVSLHYATGSPGVSAIVRDISQTGFSVVCDEVVLSQKQIIHAMLEDYFNDTDEHFQFPLYGSVVRIQELENGKTVYGCKLTGKVGGLENYIAKKDRRSIKKR